LLALLAHHFLHVSRIRVKSSTLRLLMSYIYIYMTYFVLIAAGCVGLDTCISRGIQIDTDASEQQRKFPTDE
jgi:hypothetical protein